MEIKFQLLGGAMEPWIVREFKSLELSDKRLNQRSRGHAGIRVKIGHK